MKACSIAVLKMAILLLPLLLLCGCGGGGGKGPQPDAIEILQKDGLRFSLQPDASFALGEGMPFWFYVQNEGLTARTIELRPRGDESGAETCLGSIAYEDQAGANPVVYRLSRNDTVSVQIQSGETIPLGEFFWHEVRQDNEEAASPGYYTFTIVLDNLYVDGKKPADWPTFEVRGERRVYVGPPVDPWYISAHEKLRNQGLVISIGTDKPVYQTGEPIPVWFDIRNEGTQTRTLEARPAVMDSYSSSEAGRLTRGRALQAEGLPSYLIGIQYWGPDGRYAVAKNSWAYDTVTRTIAPGETIRFVELVWDQVKGDGMPAEAGYYDIFSCLFNLYVDGQGLGYNGTGLAPEVYATIRIVE